MKPKHPIFIALAFRRQCKKLAPIKVPENIKQAALKCGVTIKD